jgi:hypothetical protein
VYTYDIPLTHLGERRGVDAPLIDRTMPDKLTAALHSLAKPGYTRQQSA